MLWRRCLRMIKTIAKTNLGSETVLSFEGIMDAISDKMLLLAAR
jgi:hypothetical protein